jgi:hypothetical protein
MAVVGMARTTRFIASIMAVGTTFSWAGRSSIAAVEAIHDGTFAAGLPPHQKVFDIGAIEKADATRGPSDRQSAGIRQRPYRHRCPVDGLCHLAHQHQIGCFGHHAGHYVDGLMTC